MTIASIAIFIIILGVLVIIHELGHFVLAKLFKVGVDEFGIGFPPRITGIKRGKTLYSINWIPIGGFVKIKGVVGGDQMDSPTTASAETTETDDHFMSRPMWQRFTILFGGILMNAVLTAVLFIIGYSVGFPSTMQNLPANAAVTNPSVIIIDVAETVPAAQAGLQAGDVIASINDEPIKSLREMQTLLQTLSPNATISLVVQRGEDEQTLANVPLTIINPATGQQGLGAQVVESGIVRLPLPTAIWYGTSKAAQLAQQIFIALGTMIVGLFTTGGTVGQISGPLGIAALTNEATQLGFIYVLQFAALLSMNLAIFNLIPFPALDGGRILFLLIELILRRPLNQKIEAVIHNIGFALLLLLIAVVTFKDIIRIF